MKYWKCAEKGESDFKVGDVLKCVYHPKFFGFCSLNKDNTAKWKEISEDEYYIIINFGVVGAFNFYDKHMDEECIGICNILNYLPGTETYESCCGHYKEPFRVFLRCNSFYSLSVIGRVFDKRYIGTNILWSVKIETKDTDVNDYPTFSIMIESNDSYENKEELMKDMEEIYESIKYWSSPNFYGYFKKTDNDIFNEKYLKTI